MSDLVVATWNWDAFMRGFMASGGSVLIVVIAFGLVGAIASVVGLVRGVSNRQTTAIALGGVGIGCAIIGLLFFPLGLWTASAVCGLMACKRSKQPRTLTYEEFKQRKAMIQDPEYAEYMRMVHGVEDTSGMTAEQKFDRSVAANPLIGLSEAEFARLNLKAKHGTMSPAEQQMAATLQEALAHCIGGENAAINPLVIENRLHDLDKDLDRLLTMEGSEIVDLRIKQISDEMLQLRQMKKRAELDTQQDMGRENKAKEIMALISAEDLDLTEYSDTLVYRVIERVTVLSKEEICIRFVGGFEITQPLH